MKYSLILLMVAVLPLTGFAKAAKVVKKSKPAAGWCETKKLPNDLPATKAQLKELFDRTDRRILIQSLWGELLSAQPRSIVVPMIQYLANTEQNEKVSGYFQTLGMAAGIHNRIEEEIEAWPNSTKPTQVKAPLKEMCDLYSHAGGDDFQ